MIHCIRKYGIVASSGDIRSLHFQGWDDLQYFESAQEFLVIDRAHFDWFCLSNFCNMVYNLLQKSSGSFIF